MIFERDGFLSARAVWLRDYSGEMNRTALFRACVPKGENTILNIAGQSTYQVFINGKFVFFGPSRAGHGFYRVDHLPIEEHLTKENNELCVLVSGYHCNSFYLVNEPAFFMCELSDMGDVFCATGTDAWQGYLYTQKLQRVERYGFQRPFCEVYDFSKMTPLAYGVPSELAILESLDGTLIKREVSYPSFPFESHKAIIERGRVEMADTYTPFSAWWTNKIGKECSGFSSDDLELSTTAIIDKLKLIKTNEDLSTELCASSYLTLEMNANITGLVRVVLTARSDTTLCLTFDELLTDGTVSYSRADCVNALIFKLQGGKKYTLITAEPYTFKYMNAISLGGEISLESLGVIRTDFNENEIIKRLKPKADEQIERIYKAAVETFRQNTYDIYMDCPSRERAGWLCDSFFTSRVEYLMSGKCRVEHAFLSNFLMGRQYSLIPNGMLPMCYPADHTDGNFIPNWAMWYVLEMKEYVERSGDKSFANEAKDRIYSLLEYLRGFENKNGLLERLKGWVFVEWSKCNSLTQNINYPTNMLYYLFKKTIASLYDDKSLYSQAEELKKAINSEAKIGIFYCDNSVYDEHGVSSLSGEITETAQYYAFFTGIADKENDRELWDVMINDFGSSRKQSNRWESIHFSNAFIGNYLRLDLLRQADMRTELEADIRGYFDYMAKTTGTLWEHDSPWASCNHGFASHVLVWLDYLGYLENK